VISAPRRPCAVCSQLTYVSPSRFAASKSKAFYCSIACRTAGRLGKPTAKRQGSDRPCNTCGKVSFQKKRARDTSNHYCSRECHFKQRFGDGRVLQMACTHCGVLHSRERNTVTKRKIGTFCSRDCYWKARSYLLAGDKSPGWKGGKTLDYGGSNWKSQRRKALLRDKSTCQDCGKKKQSHGYRMDVHHIVSYQRYKNKDRANRLENLVTLCRACHMGRHGKS
jgi:hypothetical protein